MLVGGYSFYNGSLAHQHAHGTLCIESSQQSGAPHPTIPHQPMRLAGSRNRVWLRVGGDSKNSWTEVGRRKDRGGAPRLSTAGDPHEPELTHVDTRPSEAAAHHMHVHASDAGYGDQHSGC